MRSVVAMLTLLLLGAEATQAAQLNGQWNGAGYTHEGTCPAFEITVSVTDDRLKGRAVSPDNTFAIHGELSDDGVLIGQVEYFSMAFAELKGDMSPFGGRGQWRTFKGPKCAGIFVVNKL